MRMNQTVILLLAVVFSLAAQAEAPSFTPETTVHKSVGANGKVVYGKSGFAEAPVRKPKPVEEIKAPPKSTAPKVDVYYASWDPYSNKAIVFFRDNHVVVNAYDIDLDAEAAARKKTIDPKFVGMPLVIINGVIIRGVDEKKYHEALALPPK